jgi:hypothetical protein
VIVFVKRNRTLSIIIRVVGETLLLFRLHHGLLTLLSDVRRMDMHLVIKVADFGLSESIDTTREYFRQNQKDAVKLPIKWLALESICDGVFSEKSDVVSKLSSCNDKAVSATSMHPMGVARAYYQSFFILCIKLMENCR